MNKTMNIKRAPASRYNLCNRCNNAICIGSIRFDNEFICDKEWNARHAKKHTKPIQGTWPQGWVI